jgi:thymidine phosphorylase
VAGQPLLTLFTDEAERFERAEDALVGGIEYGQNPAGDRKIILERLNHG